MTGSTAKYVVPIGTRDGACLTGLHGVGTRVLGMADQLAVYGLHDRAIGPVASGGRS